jgi:hypothetical protein
MVEGEEIISEFDVNQIKCGWLCVIEMNQIQFVSMKEVAIRARTPERPEEDGG